MWQLRKLFRCAINDLRIGRIPKQNENLKYIDKIKLFKISYTEE